MAHRNRDCDTVEEMREAFRVFDRDNLGYIPVKEIRFVISNLNVKLTQAELEELVGAVDIDGNGQVTFEEFKKMITPKWASSLSCIFFISSRFYYLINW